MEIGSDKQYHVCTKYELDVKYSVCSNGFTQINFSYDRKFKIQGYIDDLITLNELDHVKGQDYHVISIPHFKKDKFVAKYASFIKNVYNEQTKLFDISIVMIELTKANWKLINTLHLKYSTIKDFVVDDIFTYFAWTGHLYMISNKLKLHVKHTKSIKATYEIIAYKHSIIKKLKTKLKNI